MPTYHAASLSLRFTTSPLDKSLTVSPVLRSGADANNKALTAGQVLKNGNALLEHPLPWKLAGGASGQQCGGHDTSLGFLGKWEDVPFYCVGVNAEVQMEIEVGKTVGRPTDDVKVKQQLVPEPSVETVDKSDLEGDSSLTSLTSSLSSLGTTPNTTPEHAAPTAEGSGTLKKSLLPGKMSDQLISGEETQSTRLKIPPRLKKGSNHRIDTSVTAKISPTPGPFDSIAVEASTTKALALAVDLSEACFNRSKTRSPWQDLKVDVFLNGSLSHSQFVSQRNKNDRGVVQLRFSGTRIGRIQERAWTIRVRPREVHVDPGQTVGTGTESPNAAESRWNDIARALRYELDAIGVDKTGHRPPSGECLESLVRMEVPTSMIQLSHAAKTSFAIIDVVVTLGEGKKYGTAMGYMLVPQRMSDPKFVGFKQDIAASQNVFVPTKAFPTPNFISGSDLLDKSSKSGTASKLKSGPSARLQEVQSVVVAGLPQSKLPAEHDSASNIDGIAASTSTSIRDSPALTVPALLPLSCISQPIGQTSTPVEIPTGERTNGNFATPKLERLSQRVWSYRENEHGAKTPTSEGPSPSHSNGSHSEHGSGQKVVVAIDPKPTIERHDQITTTAFQQQIPKLFNTAVSDDLDEEPLSKKARLDFTGSSFASFMTSSQSHVDLSELPNSDRIGGLERVPFASPSPLRSTTAPSSPLPYPEGANASVISFSPSMSLQAPSPSSLRAALFSNLLTSGKPRSRSVPTMSPLQRLARRSNSHIASPVGLGPPRIHLLDENEADRVVSGDDSQPNPFVRPSLITQKADVGPTIGKVDTGFVLPPLPKKRGRPFKRVNNNGLLASNQKEKTGTTPETVVTSGIVRLKRKRTVTLVAAEPKTPVTIQKRRGRPPRLSPLKKQSSTVHAADDMQSRLEQDLATEADAVTGAALDVSVPVYDECIISYANALGDTSVGQSDTGCVYGIRQIKAERTGEFRESEVLLGVRFVVANW